MKRNQVRRKPVKKKKLKPIVIVLDIAIAVLVIIFIALLVWPKIAHMRQERAKDNLLDAYDQNMNAIEFGVNDFVVSGEEMEFIDGEEPEVLPDVDKVTIQAIGKMYIPKIDSLMPISNETTLYSLRVSIGHYPDSVVVGTPGTAVYFGHRMYDYGKIWNRLNEVIAGDIVVIEDKTKQYEYTIDEIRLIPGEDLFDDLNRTLSTIIDESRIQLITCHPIKVASHRLLVSGKLTKTTPLEELKENTSAGITTTSK